MRWLAPAVMVCCVAQAEAAVTLEQLAAQSEVVAGALLQYNIANDELQAMYAQQNRAYQAWKFYEAMAVLFYGGGAYERGAYYHSVAIVEESDYHRLTALILTKKADVEAKWQTYLREFAKLQAMLNEYRGQ